MEQVSSTSFIKNLPNELIILILRNNDCRDVINFGTTCKNFNKLIKDNQYLWKEKFKNIVPKPVFHIVSTLTCKGDWFQEVKEFFTIRKKIHNEIISMSPEYFMLTQDPLLYDIKSVFKIALTNNVSYYYTINTLHNIIKKGKQMVNKNICSIPYTLTEMYYARIVLQYLIYTYLSVKWVQKRMKTELTPEIVLGLFVQWIDVLNIHSDEDILYKISGIVHDVHAYLIKGNPALSKSDLPLRDKVAQKLIKEKKVLEAITAILYHQRGVTVSTSADVGAFDIEQVLKNKCGNFIAVAIIYYYIAKECGVKCEVIHFPYHFFLEWRDTTNPQKVQMYSIDIKTGELRQPRNCPFTVTPQSENYSYCPNSLLRCIMNEYVKMLGDGNQRATFSALQLIYFVDTTTTHSTPDHNGSLYYKYRCYLQNDASLSVLPTIDPHFIQDEHIHILMTLSQFAKKSVRNNQLAQTGKKKRDNNIKYAIGMVCYHKVYHYNCVIIGWDLKCDAVWQNNPINRALLLGYNQPFFWIISDDQTRRYVAQENLEHIIHPPRCQHIEDVISRFFTHFNGFAYVPNREKLEEYPDDMPISEMFRCHAESKVGIEF